MKSSLALLLADAVVGSRVAIETHRKTETGTVDFLFTIGAPATGSPGLKNPLTKDGCFPGLRAWTASYDGEDKYVDPVPGVAGIIGFRHQLMDVEEFDVDKKTADNVVKCSPKTINKPNVGVSVPLHFGSYYKPKIQQKQGAWWQEMATMIVDESYQLNFTTAATVAKDIGYHLIGSAIQGNEDTYGGKQVSHLFQKEEDLACVLTFQGTKTAGGWMANINANAVHFCGLADENEPECMNLEGVCEVQNPMSSWIHEGFADRIRFMVREPAWQKNIRPYLSSCSKVTVAGHSLGGAASTLFTACVAKAPKEGQHGYDDFKDMSWTKGPAAKLW